MKFSAGAGAEANRRVTLVMPLAEQRGGAEALLLHFLGAITRASRSSIQAWLEYDVVFLEAGPMVEACRALGVPVRVLPAGQMRQIHVAGRTIRSLASHLRERRSAVVLAWMGKAHCYSGAAAHLAKVSAAWWQHGFPGRHWIDRTSAAIPAARIYCCSKAVADAQSRLCKVPTEVIYPCVDLARWNVDELPTPAEARRELGVKGSPVIGILARLQQWKGIEVFLDAAVAVRRRRPGATFLIVGGEHSLEPGFAARLQSIIHERGLPVQMTGQQSCPERWMQAMDVVVHASVTPEPFGMVLLEALALGKPLVATAAGGPLELLGTRPDLACLVEPGRPDALAAGIELALRGECSFLTRREFASLYSSDEFAVRLNASLARLATKSAAATPVSEPSEATCVSRS